MERYVDRKLDKAEDVLKRKERKCDAGIITFVSGEESCQLKEIHIFLVAFAAGVAIGIASGHWTISLCVLHNSRIFYVQVIVIIWFMWLPFY